MSCASPLTESSTRFVLGSDGQAAGLRHNMRRDVEIQVDGGRGIPGNGRGAPIDSAQKRQHRSAHFVFAVLCVDAKKQRIFRESDFIFQQHL
jgi:hypothetical protein